MGRVKKYKDIKTLEAKIEAYFKFEDSRAKEFSIPTTKKKPKEGQEEETSITAPTVGTYTVSGLALFLGFVSTQSLLEYEQSPKYGAVIKKAKTRIENQMETRLQQGRPPIGLIFALKNRFNWQDKQGMDITSGGQTLGVIALPPR
jgi:hypothetical protein